MFSVNQILLLLTSIVVPLVLFHRKRNDLVLQWVCINLFVHIFNTELFTSISAARVVGILYMPTAIKRLNFWLKFPPVKIYLFSFFYLILLAIIFGFIFPWEDITGNRPYAMTASGRVIVHMLRVISEMSLTLFIADEVAKGLSINFIAKSLLIGTTITATFGVIQLFIPSIDFYLIITELRDLYGLDRSRGLSFEPRGLGQACAYGLLLFFVYTPKPALRILTTFFVNSIGLLASYSVSAFSLLFCVYMSILPTINVRSKAYTVYALGVIVSLVAIFAFVAPDRYEFAISQMSDRGDIKQQSGSSNQSWLYKLDPTDSSAVNFLLSNPIYALIGTGPGLMFLPSTNYYPPGIRTQAFDEVGITLLPTHGPLQEISNGGVVCLVAWLMQVVLGLRAINYIRNFHQDTAIAAEWQNGRTLFIIGIVGYTIQVNTAAPTWTVFMGIGWGAFKIFSNIKESDRQTTSKIFIN